MARGTGALSQLVSRGARESHVGSGSWCADRLQKHHVANLIPTTSIRWHNQLNPDVRKDPFTEWEDAVIVQVSRPVQRPLFPNRRSLTDRACLSGTRRARKQVGRCDR